MRVSAVYFPLEHYFLDFLGMNGVSDTLTTPNLMIFFMKLKTDYGMIAGAQSTLSTLYQKVCERSLTSKCTFDSVLKLQNSTSTRSVLNTASYINLDCYYGNYAS